MALSEEITVLMCVGSPCCPVACELVVGSVIGVGNQLSEGLGCCSWAVCLMFRGLPLVVGDVLRGAVCVDVRAEPRAHRGGDAEGDLLALHLGMGEAVLSFAVLVRLCDGRFMI